MVVRRQNRVAPRDDIGRNLADPEPSFVQRGATFARLRYAVHVPAQAGDARQGKNDGTCGASPARRRLAREWLSNLLLNSIAHDPVRPHFRMQPRMRIREDFLQ